jgi:hypothetical protein
VVTLTASQQEVHFHKVGDKIVQDDPVTLNWSSSNASKVTITPLGSESASGSQTVKPQPTQTTPGPVNEVVDYTLTASNACGGTTTQTAALHLVGSIDLPPVTLASVFYPSNYPRAAHPKLGLVESEKAALQQAANSFKSEEEYSNNNPTLMIIGYADVRGPKSYNLALSKRRAEQVKNYLASQGIAADKIQIQADGKTRQLSENDVSTLQAQDKQKPDKWMKRNKKATWMAYNRRVDIVLEPSGTKSTEAYPNGASDARVLWQRAQPSLHEVTSAGKMSGPIASVQAGTQSN